MQAAIGEGMMRHRLLLQELFDLTLLLSGNSTTIEGNWSESAPRIMDTRRSHFSSRNLSGKIRDVDTVIEADYKLMILGFFLNHNKQ